MKYTLGQIAAICSGKLAGSAFTGESEVTSVFTDSRNSGCGGNALFVAISGRNHDGHAYVNELYGRGIRAFLVEKDIATAQYKDAGFVCVDSSVAALQALAADYRQHFGGIVVGITGSNGKTIVKEWAAALIPPSEKVFRSPKSYNSQIGVPLSVLMMAGDEKISLIEAGISETGEMTSLERVIGPQIGIITNLGDAHQENFGSLGEKLNEKIGLFSNSHTIIYNSAYTDVGLALKEKYPEATLVDSAAQKEAYGFFTDRASQENAATAMALCDVLGFDHSQTVARLAELQPVAMRLELKEGLSNSLIINDSYNSDINSLSIALDYLNSVAGGRQQTLILSDILQSGYPEAELYVRVAELVARSQVARLIGVGENIRKYGKLFNIPSSFYPSTDVCLASLTHEDTAGRVVLIKGNRDSQFERLSHALEMKSHTTSLETDLDAMIHNLNTHRALLKPSTRIMAMVKAAGYGHGTYEVANMLQHQGVDYLAVAFADEGVLLRRQGITMPIVVLNADAGSFELMVANSLEPEIYNFSSLADFTSAVRRYGERTYPVHIKLDTGMHRLGFEEADIDGLKEKLLENGELLRVSSIFSHLASSDNPGDDRFTELQIARFIKMSEQLSEDLSSQPLLHIANSAAIERFPIAQFDMVRLGIGLYGVGAAETPLMHVSTLRTRIVQVKQVDSPETVGYGCEGVIDAPTRLATIPIGYADGIDRRLGNGNWNLLVNGIPAPTIGRICMDICMIDITGIDAVEGDEVIIYGKTTGNTIEDMARVLGTIPYEVMTGISARVKRIYVKE